MKSLKEFLNENKINENTIKTKNFDINIENDKVIVDITKNDSIEQEKLNDLSSKWTQHSWGYEIQIDNEKQQKELIKQLKKMSK